jgi:hypothetical protein
MKVFPGNLFLRRTVLVVAGLLCFWAGSGFASDQLTEALARFEISATKASRSLFGGRGDSQATIPLLAQLRQHIDTGHWKEAIETVHKIRYANQADEVVRIGSEVIEQIEIRGKAAAEAELREIDVAVNRAAEVCVKANDARDLDKTVEELRSLSGRWHNDGREESVQVFRARARLAATLGYAQVWQEYLGLRAAGKEVEAARRMEDLARKSEWASAVPRSEVLARSFPPSPTPAPPSRFRVDNAIKNLLALLKSRDDLDTVAGQAEELAEKEPSGSKMRAISDQLKRLQGARRAIAAEDYAAAFRLCTERSADYVDTANELIMLRQQIVLEILPRYLPPRNLATPLADESPSNYLLRIARAALDAKDWLLALRSFEALGSISFGQHWQPSWLTADISSLNALVQGDKEIAVGELAHAAASYQRALDAPSDNAPIATIAEKLRALRKQHPEAFLALKPGPSPAGPRK